jgi:hypothetical protein
MKRSNWGEKTNTFKVRGSIGEGRRDEKKMVSLQLSVREASKRDTRQLEKLSKLLQPRKGPNLSHTAESGEERVRYLASKVIAIRHRERVQAMCSVVSRSSIDDRLRLCYMSLQHIQYLICNRHLFLPLHPVASTHTGENDM